MKQFVPFEQRSASLKSWHKRAQLFRLAGKTTHGKRRQRRVYRTESDRQEAERKRSLDRYYERALANHLEGKTTRGVARVYRLNKMDRLILSAEFDGLAAVLAECFPQLPPKAQAKVVELAGRLAELKGKVVL
jgi:hypothetical protein